jgi:DNA-directed RNA polymerase
MIMQPTPQQIDEQVELERHAIKQGLKRLQDQTLKLEGQNYGSATIYGISSIHSLLPRLVSKIKDTNSRIHERKNGVAFKDIHQYLEDIDEESAAAIACKMTFDKVFGYKDGCNLVTNVCESIGRAIEDECQMRHYETHAPGLLSTLKKNYWHKSIGTQQKFVVIKTLMNRYEVKQWTAWTRSIRIKLGAWLLDCIMESSQWFMKQSIRQGRKTSIFVVPTPEFMDIKDEVMANAELFAPLAWPMLIPPKDWSNEQAGGYMLNEVMHGHDLVRRGNHPRIQGETPLAFLNKIQKVGYTCNSFTVKVAETLQEKGIAVGKFLPIVHYDLPPKPVDIATNAESRKAYRRAAAEVMNKRAAEFKKSCRTRMTMEAVERFKDRDRFFCPWSFDYRGRAYPIPAFLTPQDTDFGKSLIRSADEAYITESGKKWLAFQVATTYGLDKSTMAERLSWTHNNTHLIAKVAIDPIGNRVEWEVADEPWQFLAACEEYYSVVLTEDRKTTGLFVATDATCSGLQILAGLARDRSTAQLVNVLPADRPQDAYKVVADVAKPNCPMHIQKVMDRKTVKRTVMTIPYNAKPYSNRSYIRDALLDKGIEIDKEDLTVTVQAVRDAMEHVVPGPMAVMKWIETEVSKAIKRGAKELQWVTPSGFVVNQRIMKKDVTRLELQLLGRCRISVATDDTDEVDINRHRAATAPNLIHSLDASLLHLSINKFDKPIALIHDSVLTQSVDMDELSAIIRETYMHLFAEHDYLNDFALQIGAETEPPIIGDLKPESVINSTYFFC